MGRERCRASAGEARTLAVWLAFAAGVAALLFLAGRGATTTVNSYPMRVSTHLWHDPDDVDRVTVEVKPSEPYRGETGRALADARFANAGAQVVSSGSFRLMWDLAKSDL